MSRPGEKHWRFSCAAENRQEEKSRDYIKASKKKGRIMGLQKCSTIRRTLPLGKLFAGVTRGPGNWGKCSENKNEGPISDATDHRYDDTKKKKGFAMKQKISGTRTPSALRGSALRKGPNRGDTRVSSKNGKREGLPSGHRRKKTHTWGNWVKNRRRGNRHPD